MTHEEHLERQVLVAAKGIEGLRKLLLAAEARADAAEARAALAERQVRVLAGELAKCGGCTPDAICRADERCDLCDEHIADTDAWAAWSSAQAGGGDGE